MIKHVAWCMVCVCVFQTRVDFTVCNGILIVLAVDLLMFGFFSTFYYSNVLQIVYGSLGALLYALVSHQVEEINSNRFTSCR